MNISARVKATRDALKLKQTELAEKIGVSYRAVQGYEAGRSVPGGEAIEGFARLGINANWLLTGDGPMFISDLLSGAIEDLRGVESLQRILDEVRAAA